MNKVEITLRGDDAKWFRELKQEESDARRGSAPSNAELVRLFMREYDSDPA